MRGDKLAFVNWRRRVMMEEARSCGRPRKRRKRAAPAARKVHLASLASGSQGSPLPIDNHSRPRRRKLSSFFTFDYSEHTQLVQSAALRQVNWHAFPPEDAYYRRHFRAAGSGGWLNGGCHNGATELLGWPQAQAKPFRTMRNNRSSSNKTKTKTTLPAGSAAIHSIVILSIAIQMFLFYQTTQTMALSSSYQYWSSPPSSSSYFSSFSSRPYTFTSTLISAASTLSRGRSSAVASASPVHQQTDWGAAAAAGSPTMRAEQADWAGDTQPPPVPVPVPAHVPVPVPLPAPAPPPPQTVSLSSGRSIILPLPSSNADRSSQASFSPSPGGASSTTATKRKTRKRKSKTKPSNNEQVDEKVRISAIELERATLAHVRQLGALNHLHRRPIRRMAEASRIRPRRHLRSLQLESGRKSRDELNRRALMSSIDTICLGHLRRVEQVGRPVDRSRLHATQRIQANTSQPDRVATSSPPPPCFELQCDHIGRHASWPADRFHDVALAVGLLASQLRIYLTGTSGANAGRKQFQRTSEQMSGGGGSGGGDGTGTGKVGGAQERELCRALLISRLHLATQRSESLDKQMDDLSRSGTPLLSTQLETSNHQVDREDNDDDHDDDRDEQEQVVLVEVKSARQKRRLRSPTDNPGSSSGGPGNSAGGGGGGGGGSGRVTLDRGQAKAPAWPQVGINHWNDLAALALQVVAPSSPTSPSKWLSESDNNGGLVYDLAPLDVPLNATAISSSSSGSTTSGDLNPFESQTNPNNGDNGFADNDNFNGPQQQQQQQQQQPPTSARFNNSADYTNDNNNNNNNQLAGQEGSQSFLANLGHFNRPQVSTDGLSGSLSTSSSSSKIAPLGDRELSPSAALGDEDLNLNDTVGNEMLLAVAATQLPSLAIQSNGENGANNNNNGLLCNQYAIIKNRIPTLTIRLVFFLLYGLIFAIGLIGNTLTLYAMKRKKERSSTIDIFIANLALSDIMLCIFAVPITPIYLLYYGNWVFGPGLCKAFAFAQGASVYISTFTMISIAHLRYQLIVHPLQDSMSKLVAFLLNLLTWILGLLVTLPYLMHVGLLPENCAIKFCDEYWEEDIDRFWFSVITLILQFFLPFIAVSFFYGSIFWKLRCQKKKRQLDKQQQNQSFHNLTTSRSLTLATMHNNNNNNNNNTANANNNNNNIAVAAATTTTPSSNVPENTHRCHLASGSSSTLTCPAATGDALTATGHNKRRSSHRLRRLYKPLTGKRAQSGALVSTSTLTLGAQVTNTSTSISTAAAAATTNPLALINQSGQQVLLMRTPRRSSHDERLIMRINRDNHERQASICKLDLLNCLECEQQQCSLANNNNNNSNNSNSNNNDNSGNHFACDCSRPGKTVSDDCDADKDSDASITNNPLMSSPSLAGESGQPVQRPTTLARNLPEGDGQRDEGSKNDEDESMRSIATQSAGIMVSITMPKLTEHALALNASNSLASGQVGKPAAQVVVEQPKQQQQQHAASLADLSTLSQATCESNLVVGSQKVQREQSPTNGELELKRNLSFVNNKSLSAAKSSPGETDSPSRSQLSLSSLAGPPETSKVANCCQFRNQQHQHQHQHNHHQLTSCVSPSCAKHHPRLPQNHHNHHHHHHHHHHQHQHQHRHRCHLKRSASKPISEQVGSAMETSIVVQTATSMADILALKEQRLRDKDKRLSQTNRKLLFMVVLFVCSWLPLNMFNLVQDYSETISESPYIKHVFLIVHLIACSSVCYNPILYAWMSDNYRQELRDILPKALVQRCRYLAKT